MELNPEQLAVVSEFDGARCLLACPGAGKTSTLVALIKRMLDSGIPASEIKAVTFSNSMAKVLADRIGVDGIASTFHSLGYAICSEGGRKPVEPELRYRLMIKLVKQWRLDYHEFDNFLARMRREGITPENSLNDENDYGMCRAYAMYEKERAEAGWIDFGAMVADALVLLENPEIRARWSPRYLIADECQDTSDDQFKMLQFLSEKHGNITCTGDASQAIYSFRGAEPDNLLNFQKYFPNSKTLFLTCNYRSTRRIVKFIRENTPPGTPEELRERMVAARNEEGERIGMKMYWQLDDEAEAALVLAQKDPLHSIVLARTNHVVGVLERICAQNKIKYHLLGKTSFWKQAEISKALEALKPFATSLTEMAMNMALPALEAKYAVDDRTERDNDALANLRILRTYAKEHPQTREFLAYANKMVHRRNDARGVTLSTVHQAKGLEFNRVFIVGANADGFPHKKGEPLEEARIWYVAISRAADTLRISFSGTPSPYLRKYLTEEILGKLAETAHEVERLQIQGGLF